MNNIKIDLMINHIAKTKIYCHILSHVPNKIECTHALIYQSRVTYEWHAVNKNVPILKFLCMIYDVIYRN